MFFGTDSFQEIWNGYDMRNVRVKMLNGEKLPECQDCWDEEADGQESMRLKENRRFFQSCGHHLKSAQNNEGYVSGGPVYLDLRLSNKCNLKCRTCGPSYSSLWHKELKKHEQTMKTNHTLRNTYQFDFNKSGEMENWYNTDVFFNLIKDTYRDLKRIYISGGEPFLIKGHHLFIDYFLKTKVHRNIDIYINSNMTYLDTALLKKLIRFKELHLSVSIDAYGERNNWLRSPSNFSTIERNMETVLQLPKNVKISICCTVSVYNILYVPELINWSRKIARKLKTNAPLVYFNMLHQPEFQHVSILSQILKKKAAEQLNEIETTQELYPVEKANIKSVIGILQRSMADDEKTEHLRTLLKEHTAILDQWREENFFSVFPEFVGHL